jgi:ribosomal protein S18 acetylase RimI-like enzyme
MMTTLEIREARSSELQEAAVVLSRGMRDNPNHVAAFGDDPETRRRKLAAVFGLLLPRMAHAPLLGVRDGSIVAVWGMAEPGQCQLTPSEALRSLPSILWGCGVPATIRLLTWLRAWGSLDPTSEHWHLGPVGVDAHLQGKGIGSQVMGAWCAMLDDRGATGYLETDKPENVRFYAKFGFQTVAESEVLERPNWFMSRAAK